LDEQKRQVLERNSRRFPTPQPYGPPSQSDTAAKIQLSSPSSPTSHVQTTTGSNSTVTPTYPPPPSQMAAPAGVYSSRPPYQLGGVSPSPVRTQAQQETQQTSISSKPPPPPSQPQIRSPQEYVQLGIQHHEANRLKDSATCFEKGAKELGGCGAGMLMWGLALRHGWGCDKDEKQGFKWLRKAAESAVVDLETARGGMDSGAVQSELVFAIYEVAQCFFQGWGVSKDQKMAVSYYAVAARLGDMDAQHDLAFCLANGKGCKKDRKESARWYRAAVAQGASDVGLAWIYKEKFQ